MIEELGDVVKHIKLISQNTINTSIPHLRSLDNTKSVILKRLMKKLPGGIPKNTALEKLQSLGLEKLEFPNRILSEIDAFQKNLLSDEELFSNHGEYPYFAQVWYGDVYDVTGVESLRMLQDDLIISQKSIRHLDKLIIKECVEFFAVGDGDGAPSEEKTE